MSGTVRSDLEPFSEHDDAALVSWNASRTKGTVLIGCVTQYKALRRVHLIPSESGMPEETVI